MLNPWFISFTLQVFWMKMHSKLNKLLDCYIVSDLRFLLEIQAILPETKTFLSNQMAGLSSFFQMFIVLGMYNFAIDVELKSEHRRSFKTQRSQKFSELAAYSKV